MSFSKFGLAAECIPPCQRHVSTEAESKDMREEVLTNRRLQLSFSISTEVECAYRPA